MHNAELRDEKPLLNQLYTAGRIRARQLATVGLGPTTWLVCIGLVLGIVVDASINSLAAKVLASLVFYCCSAVGVGWFVLRHLLSRIDPLSEAHQIERRFPDVQHSVVPALDLLVDEEQNFVAELGVHRSTTLAESANHKSGTSRAFVETTIQAAVDTCSSLPWDRYVSSRRRAVAKRTALVATAVLLCLFLQPFGALARRAGRVAFPWANLGRAASVNIEIISPQVQEGVHPLGEPLTVVARFSSNWSGQATLELLTADNAKQQFDMVVAAAVGPEALMARAAFIPSSELQRFRVVADGAETPWIKIIARPRPSAQELELEVAPPAYTRIEPYTVGVGSEKSVRALAGSKLRFTLSKDGPLESASLLLAAGDDQPKSDAEPLEFSVRANGRLESPLVTLDHDLQADVVLVDGATGLQGRLPYALDVKKVNNAPPEIVWLSHKDSEVLVSRDARVELQASVTDEMVVDKITAEVTVGRGDADNLTQLVVEPAEDNDLASWRWRANCGFSLSMNDYAVNIGDRVVVRVLATDRHGSESASTERTFVIRATESSAPDREETRSRVKIFMMLDDLAVKLAEAEEVTKLSLPRIADTADSVKADCRSILSDITQAIAKSTTTTEKLELQATGEALANLEQILALGFNADSAAELGAQQAIDRNLLTAQFQDAASLARDIATGYRQVLSGYGVRTVAAESAAILKVQERVVRQLNGESVDEQQSSIARLAKMQAVVVTQLEELQSDAEDLSAAMDEGTGTKLRASLIALGTALTMAGREGRNNNVNALKHNAAVLRAVLQKLSEPLAVDPVWPQTYKTGMVTLTQGLNRLGARKTAPALSAASFGTEEIALGLAARRAVVRAANLSVGEYSSDLGLASRAAKSLNHAARPEIGRLQQSADILRVLYELELVDFLLRAQWTDDDLAMTSALAIVEAHVESLVSGIGRSQWPAVVSDTGRRSDLPHLQAQALKLRELVSEHRIAQGDRTGESTAGVNVQTTRTLPLTPARMRTLHREIQATVFLLEPFAEAARRHLRGLLPSLSDQARQAAYESQQLSLASKDLSTEYSRDAVTDAAGQIRSLDGRQGGIQNKLAELRDALVDLAERQDLLAESDIARAQLADDIRRQVDVAGEQLSASLDGVSSTVDPRETGPRLAYASAVQQTASELLENLVPRLQMLESDEMLLGGQDREESNTDGGAQDPSDAAEAGVDEPAGRAEQQSEDAVESPGEMTASSDTTAYEEAQQLAALAGLTAEELIEMLEGQLQQSVQMQGALSDIAREALTQAARLLRESASDLSSAHTTFKATDARVVIHDQRQSFETQFHQEYDQVLNSLLQQTSQAAELGRQSGLREEILAAQELLVSGQEEAKAVRESLVAQARDQSAIEPRLSDGEQEAMLREARDRGRRAQQALLKALRRLISTRQQQQRKLERISANNADDVKTAELQSLQDSVKALQTVLAEVSRSIQIDDQTANPGAALAAYLLDLFGQQSRLRQHASLPEKVAPAPQIARKVIANSDLVDDLASNRRIALEQINRSARHEGRLGNTELATVLAMISEQLTQRGLEFEADFAAAENSETGGVLSAAASQSLLDSMDLHRRVLAATSERIERLLDIRSNSDAQNPNGQEGSPNQASPAQQDAGQGSNTALSQLPMDASELAALLDELDAAMHSEASFGPSEDDGQRAPSQATQPTGSSSQTLQQQARQLAQSLSSNRKPPPGKSKGDLGTATESQMSDTTPQNTAAYSIVDVDRLAGEWGELTEQTLQNATEGQRQSVAPEYRRQVDAYFRRLRGEEPR